MTDYAEYLDSPEWAQKRAHVLARDEYRCQDCGASRELHVHHLTYDDVGDEPHWQLITLCADCHLARHDTTFHRAWNGATWDERGSATRWRSRNWPELQRSPWNPERPTAREESFYAEDIYGPLGGDSRHDAEWLDELMDRDT